MSALAVLSEPCADCLVLVRSVTLVCVSTYCVCKSAQVDSIVERLTSLAADSRLAEVGGHKPEAYARNKSKQEGDKGYRPYCSARTLTAGRKNGGHSPTAIYGGMRGQNFPSQVTIVGDEGGFTFDTFATSCSSSLLAAPPPKDVDQGFVLGRLILDWNLSSIAQPIRNRLGSGFKSVILPNSMPKDAALRAISTTSDFRELSVYRQLYYRSNTSTFEAKITLKLTAPIEILLKTLMSTYFC